MKKFYILVLFISAFGSQAQVINFPDPNLKTALLVPGVARNNWFQSIDNIDANGNGEIEIYEASQVYVLDINTRNITELIGMEYFMNLHSLDCGQNLISSLSPLNDLPIASLGIYGNQFSGILNLTGFESLQYLDCNSNDITSLNLNGLNLLGLQCADNEISTLDVSVFTQMTSLDCSNNLLTDLDVTALTNLNYLLCSGNALSSLNLNTQPNLLSLYCNNNNLSQLNLQPLVNLQFLDCSFNNLTQINVPSPSSLVRLYCASNNLSSLSLLGLNALYLLNCDDNNLSSLTLSGLDNLNTLECRNNNLASLDFTGMPWVRNVYCSYNNFSTMNTFGAAYIDNLDCSHNMITSLILSGGGPHNVNCSHNEISVLNTGNIGNIDCSFNSLTSLSFVGSFNNGRTSISCGNNQLTSLTLTGQTSWLEKLHCENNQLSTLVIPITSFWTPLDLDCSNNNLISLFLGNQRGESPINFSGNPNLSYICEDSDQVSELQTLAASYGYNNCSVDSACVLKTDEVEVYKLFTIYPNPATDVLHVKSKENTSITSLSVYNTLGQLIITVTNPQQTIDVSELLSGNYFIKITSNKGIANARFVKK